MKTPIKERIRTAIQAAGGRLEYYALAIEVFPQDEYPRAFGYSINGGPPGCYMSLSRAIREMNLIVDGHGPSGIVTLAER